MKYILDKLIYLYRKILLAREIKNGLKDRYFEYKTINTEFRNVQVLN